MLSFDDPCRLPLQNPRLRKRRMQSSLHRRRYNPMPDDEDYLEYRVAFYGLNCVGNRVNYSIALSRLREE